MVEVADLGEGVETARADDDVGNAPALEGLFQQSRRAVGAGEDEDVGPAVTAALDELHEARRQRVGFGPAQLVELLVVQAADHQEGRRPSHLRAHGVNPRGLLREEGRVVFPAELGGEAVEEARDGGAVPPAGGERLEDLAALGRAPEPLGVGVAEAVDRLLGVADDLDLDTHFLEGGEDLALERAGVLGLVDEDDRVAGGDASQQVFGERGQAKRQELDVGGAQLAARGALEVFLQRDLVEAVEFGGNLPGGHQLSSERPFAEQQLGLRDRRAFDPLEEGRGLGGLVKEGRGGAGVEDGELGVEGQVRGG